MSVLPQHARLGGLGGKVLPERLELGLDDRGRHPEELADAEGVLGGDRGHREGPEDAQGRKGPQVGRDARSGAGVGRRNGEGDLGGPRREAPWGKER